MKHKITIAKGDGIGPEIMDAVISILKAAKAPLEYEEVVIGQKAYEAGHMTGMSPEALEIIKKNSVMLKSPISTPQGGGYKSMNVTIRKSFNLFANVRPVKTLKPFVKALVPSMDLVIIRENEEDLYAGIEYQHTEDFYQAVKVITRQGCERIVRYAFEYAKANGRKKVTCMSKDNIMKHTDGLFHKIFDEVKLEYPEIETNHYIVDIGSARIASRSQEFDVIVTLNLYGDIISDIAAEVAGSVGVCGSANAGENFAMFEAIHGSAPDIAGQQKANPSGLLQGALMMLVHLGEGETANLIYNAWAKTLEDGVHTGDLKSEQTKKLVSTQEFADAVCTNLGQGPSVLKPAAFLNKPIKIKTRKNPVSKKELRGVDIFIQHEPNKIKSLVDLLPKSLPLSMVCNRGVKIYPGDLDHISMTDVYRCRYLSSSKISQSEIIDLLAQLSQKEVLIIKTENLYYFNNKPGFSQSQGE